MLSKLSGAFDVSSYIIIVIFTMGLYTGFISRIFPVSIQSETKFVLYCNTVNKRRDNMTDFFQALILNYARRDLSYKDCGLNLLVGAFFAQDT